MPKSSNMTGTHFDLLTQYVSLLLRRPGVLSVVSIQFDDGDPTEMDILCHMADSTLTYFVVTNASGEPAIKESY